VRGGLTIRRAYLDVPHGQLHLRLSGEGGQPLLLLHQSPLSGAMFDAALPLLAAHGFSVAALDTPGYGASDPLPDEPTIAGYADAVSHAIQALGWERTHVLGHHTGASIAASLAARHSAAVAKLVLNGVALLSDAERAHFSQFRFEPLQPRPDGGHLTDAWQQRLAATPGWSDIAAMHRYVVEMLGNPDRYHLGFTAAFAHDVAADLRRISAPVLVLTNTGDDLYQASRRAAALRPEFTWHALEGGTHDIVDEQPGAWAAAVAQFLRA
jgi:pimeloyl-ACP methyl ester carboxylesterase